MTDKKMIPSKNDKLAFYQDGLEKRGLQLISELAKKESTTILQTPSTNIPKPKSEIINQNELVISLAPGIEMVFVFVPSGEFIMGGMPDTFTKSLWKNNYPQHTVYLDDFWVAKYPVTIRQFSAFVEATKYIPIVNHGYYYWQTFIYEHSPDDEMWSGNWKHPLGPISNVLNKSNHPVTWIDWHAANAFCEWASGVSERNVRLPSEAQWEKAARGTDGRFFPWGNDNQPINRCNLRRFRGDKADEKFINDTTPVGAFSPQGDSPYGCADMLGNIYEWCEDYFDKDYYIQGVNRNPRGPEFGEERVQRGGLWAARWAFFTDTDVVLSAAERTPFEPDKCSYMTGFRCVIE